MALTKQEVELIDAVATSTNAILAQIPVEKVDEVQTELINKLAELKGQPKPSIVDTIGFGLDALDKGAAIAPANKQGDNFRTATSVIKAIFALLAGQGGGLIQLFSLIGKGKKALK
jgi:hypothetical protein